MNPVIDPTPHPIDGGRTKASRGAARESGSPSAKDRTWKPFVALESATLLSGAGNGIAMIALPWIVLDLTGRASDAGLVAAISALPVIATALFAGTVVDRVGRRRTSVFSDLMSALSVATIPIIATVGQLTLGWLMLLGVVGALFDPAGATARETMLPAAARMAGLRLERANGIHEAVFGVAFLVAPGVGGLLIAVVGAEATLWATAAAFILASALMVLVRVPGGARPKRDDNRLSFWAETVEGLRFVRDDHGLRTLALIYLVVVGLWLPIEGVILPFVFQSDGNATGLGLLLTAMSAGMVVGSLAYGWIGYRIPRRPAVLIALVGTGLPVIGMAFFPPLPWMLALGFASGLLFGPVNPIVNVVMQERSPEAMRGRILGVFTSAAYAAGPIGLLIVGPAVDTIGVHNTFLVLAIGVTAVGVGAIGLAGLHDLEPRPPSPVPPSETSTRSGEA